MTIFYVKGVMKIQKLDKKFYNVKDWVKMKIMLNTAGSLVIQ